MKERITVVRNEGMTDINSENFGCAFIDNMYGEQDGRGYQGWGDEEKDTLIEKLCGEIHDRLKNIESIMGE